jgi:NAD(P)-dependent dehydrogenase (short-subunit alcohol dehydrogenase family)
MARNSYNPNGDMPSLAGRVIMITGGTAGLGASTIQILAEKGPAHIFFTGRNQKAADTIIARSKRAAPRVPVTFIRNDISSLKSTQEAADTFKAACDRLDILMLNAGIMAVPAATSVDGYETHFATNHMGHALLIKLLLPTMQRTAKQPNSDVRIINLSSVAYENAPSQGIEFDTLKSKQTRLGNPLMPAKWTRYGQSKLANLLYVRELAKKYPEITSVAVHPGVIRTGLIENLGLMDRATVALRFAGQWTPLEEGPYNQCWAALVEKDQLENGGYYAPIAKLTVPTTKTGKDAELSKKLWEWTQKELAPYE